MSGALGGARDAISRLRRPAARALLLGLAASWVAAGSPAAGPDRERQVAEDRIKAAFLFKFAGFVDWPESAFPSAEAPLTIGVIGSEAVAAELGRIATGRRVNGRPVEIRRLSPEDEAGDCQEIFFGRDLGEELGPLLRRLRGPATLAVTDVAEGLALGGSINFVVVDDKVRFDVSPAPPDADGPRISARLLAVARSVVNRPT